MILLLFHFDHFDLPRLLRLLLLVEPLPSLVHKFKVSLGACLVLLLELLELKFVFKAYMQKTCDVAEKAILAKKKLRKKCVNRDKSA